MTSSDRRAERLTQCRSERGLTLVELMIVVAIIGLLAAIAVPAFRNYQFTSKRAEAYSNLAALVKTQKSFYAEYGAYVGVPIAESGFSQGSLPAAEKREVAELEVAFASVGWTPDGNVFYDYDSVSYLTDNGQDHPDCFCESCLTVTAYGDVDADNSSAMISYIQPDEAGTTSCGTGLLGYGPPINAAGDPIFSEVVRMPAADDF
jgi:prepilin-type N-terminal cleavage/methylation domain-containing protein